MTNLFSKVKGKLTRKEKQAEKIAQNKAPQDVDIAKAPDVRVTDTRPAEPDKPPQGGPPKPVLQAPVQPDPPHGTQKPDLSQLPHVQGKAGAPPSAEEQARDKDNIAGDGKTTANGHVDEQPTGLAAKGATAAERAPTPGVPLLPPTPASHVIDASWVVLGLVVLAAVFWLFLIEIMPPRLGEFLWYAILGAPLGFGYGFWRHKNQQHKNENIDKLNVYPGLKGLKELLGHVPSWVSYEEKERVEWLNSTLRQMWPFYDAAVCATVKETVEPILDMYKPPGLIKKIYFRRLTFGNAPIRIDNVWVDKQTPEELILEASFRWAGDANIAIAIEPAVAGSTLRMVPKVSDLRVSGTFRIVCKPLIDEIPVVAGMIVALKAPPEVHFNLSLGRAFGGTVVAKPIMLWLDPFLRTTLADLIVWPNRIVVPLSYDPDFDYSVLEMRHVGVLKVEAIGAQDLKKYDVLGKSDPFLEVFTLPLHKSRTKVAHKTLKPQWNEELHVLVQEPSTQLLRVEMFDHDIFNVKELLKINVAQGLQDTVNSQTFMGRCVIEIGKFSKTPNEPIDDWYDMGIGVFSNPDGCGRGEGIVHLRITYTPFTAFQRHPADSITGALLVRLVKAEDLAARDGTTSDPFATFEFKHAKKQQSWIIYKTLDPSWNQKFEWFDMAATEVMTVEFYDDDLIGDEFLGSLTFDIGEELRKLPLDCRNAEWHQAFPLEKVALCEKTKIRPPSKVTMKIQWIPYTYADHETGHAGDKKHKHHKLTGWMHKSHDKKAPTLSAAEAAEGRGASFTGEHARRTTSGSMQGMSPGQSPGASLQATPRASFQGTPRASYQTGSLQATPEGTPRIVEGQSASPFTAGIPRIAEGQQTASPPFNDTASPFAAAAIAAASQAPPPTIADIRTQQAPQQVQQVQQGQYHNGVAGGSSPSSSHASIDGRADGMFGSAPPTPHYEPAVVHQQPQTMPLQPQAMHQQETVIVQQQMQVNGQQSPEPPTPVLPRVIEQAAIEPLRTNR